MSKYRGSGKSSNNKIRINSGLLFNEILVRLSAIAQLCRTEGYSFDEAVCKPNARSRHRPPCLKGVARHGSSAVGSPSAAASRGTFGGLIEVLHCMGVAAQWQI